MYMWSQVEYCWPGFRPVAYYTVHGRTGTFISCQPHKLKSPPKHKRPIPFLPLGGVGNKFTALKKQRCTHSFKLAVTHTHFATLCPCSSDSMSKQYTFLKATLFEMGSDFTEHVWTQLNMFWYLFIIMPFHSFFGPKRLKESDVFQTYTTWWPCCFQSCLCITREREQNYPRAVEDRFYIFCKEALENVPWNTTPGKWHSNCFNIQTET